MNIKDNYIVNFLRKIKYYWYPKEGSIRKVLDALNEAQIVRFVEIGANQMDRNDHIARYLVDGRWKGVLVEPQKDVFSRLQLQYKDNPNIMLINAAISKSSSSQKLYKFNFSEESWVTSLSSFFKDRLIKHLEHGWLKARASEWGYTLSDIDEQNIGFEMVECMPFSAVLERIDSKQVDLLIIDTEGYDFEILKMIDFKTFKPAVIVFEHRHLIKKDFKAALKLLRKEKYRLFVEGGDSFGCLVNRRLS